MTPLVFVLLVLAVYRATLLVVADKISEDLRDWVLDETNAERHPKIAVLIECPWCVSIWLGFPAAGTAVVWGHTTSWQIIAGGLAASGVSGLLASLAKP